MTEIRIDSLQFLQVIPSATEKEPVEEYWLGPVRMIREEQRMVDSTPVAFVNNDSSIEWWADYGGKFVKMLQKKPCVRKMYTAFRHKEEYDDKTALLLLKWKGVQAVKDAGIHLWRMKNKYARFHGLKLSVSLNEFLFYGAAFLFPHKVCSINGRFLKNFEENKDQLKEFCEYLIETI